MVGPRSKIFLRLGLVIVVGLAALGMRLYFANRHVIDQDEPTYLNAALRYTQLPALRPVHLAGVGSE